LNSYIEYISNRLNLANVPLSKRFYQVTNALLASIVGKSWQVAHVIEFPKCGGSWVSNMLRSYVGVERNDGYRLLEKDDVVQKHALYRASMSYPIVVVRDPRDMYVSCYYHETQFEGREVNLAVERYFQRDPNRSLREDFGLYLEAKLLNRTHPRFFYSQFLDSWLNRPEVCVLRYEDCLIDPEAALVRMVRFTNRAVDLRRIREAVEENEFKAVTRRLYGEEREAGEGDGKRFVRKGVAGDWRNHFDERSCNLIEKIEGSSIRRLGYEEDRDWIPRFLESEGFERKS
jgi:hypothetical protein